MELIRQPEFARWLENADHVDVKTTTGPASISLQDFVAGVFTYQPVWVHGLLAVRWAFVRLLGMRQEGIPPRSSPDPARVPITPGDTFEFLTVKQVTPDRVWIGGADDKHLSFDVIAAVEPLDDPGATNPAAQDRLQCRFYLATVVRYNHWTGPLYFNVIRPFHHLIVWLAVRQAVRRASPSTAQGGSPA